MTSPRPSPTKQPESAEDKALADALAAEHATIYGYGVAGAFLRGADRRYAVSALDTHLRIRDQLTALITARHASPVVTEPAYRLPMPVTDRPSARCGPHAGGRCWRSGR